MPIKIPYAGKESTRRRSTSYEKFKQKTKKKSADVEMNPRMPLLNKIMGSTDQLDKLQTVNKKQNKLTIFENIAFDMNNST